MATPLHKFSAEYSPSQRHSHSKHTDKTIFKWDVFNSLCKMFKIKCKSEFILFYSKIFRIKEEIAWEKLPCFPLPWVLSGSSTRKLKLPSFTGVLGKHIKYKQGSHTFLLQMRMKCFSFIFAWFLACYHTKFYMAFYGNYMCNAYNAYSFISSVVRFHTPEISLKIIHSRATPSKSNSLTL